MILTVSLTCDNFPCDDVVFTAGQKRIPQLPVRRLSLWIILKIHRQILFLLIFPVFTQTVFSLSLSFKTSYYFPDKDT